MSAAGLDFDDVVGRLRDVRRSSATQAEGLCPAHDDKDHRSLSVTKKNGKVLLKCFVGCTFAEIMAALGATRNGARNGARRPPLTLEAFAAHKKLPAAFLREQGVTSESWGLHIAYRHRDGRLARQQRRRTALVAKDGSKWIKGAGAPIAYGAWRLDDALERGELHLVEGESNVLAAWLHNLPALGIPGADMAKVLTAEDLAGIQRLYLFQDPDQGGKTFVAGIAARLFALHWPGEALVVRLTVKDLADLHVAAGDDFAAQLAAAKAAAVPLPLAAAAVTPESAADGPVLVTLADVEAEDVEWAWVNRIARGKLGLTVSSGTPVRARPHWQST